MVAWMSDTHGWRREHRVNRVAAFEPRSEHPALGVAVDIKERAR